MGSLPGPSTDPEGAPINQEQVSPHDTPRTSTSALNKTDQMEGGEAEADPAARPKGNHRVHGTPAITPIKTTDQTSTIGAEGKDMEPTTPVSRDAPSTTSTAPTGPPASSSAGEQKAPEERTGGSPAPPANPDPNQGSTAEPVSSGTLKTNRNLAPQFNLEPLTSVPRKGLQGGPKNYVHTGSLSEGDLGWLELSQEDRTAITLKAIDSLNKKLQNTFIAVAFQEAHAEDPCQGFGLFARRDLKAGTEITPYIGEILTKKELEARYPEYEGQYVLEIEPDRFVDAADVRLASQARFANQPASGLGEAPNAEYTHTGSGATLQIIKKVLRGQEIRVQYRPDNGAHCTNPGTCTPASQTPVTTPLLSDSLYATYATRTHPPTGTPTDPSHAIIIDLEATVDATVVDLVGTGPTTPTTPTTTTENNRHPTPLESPHESQTTTAPYSTDAQHAHDTRHAHNTSKRHPNKQNKTTTKTLHIAQFNQPKADNTTLYNDTDTSLDSAHEDNTGNKMDTDTPHTTQQHPLQQQHNANDNNTADLTNGNTNNDNNSSNSSHNNDNISDKDSNTNSSNSVNSYASKVAQQPPRQQRPHHQQHQQQHPQQQLPQQQHTQNQPPQPMTQLETPPFREVGIVIFASPPPRKADPKKGKKGEKDSGKRSGGHDGKNAKEGYKGKPYILIQGSSGTVFKADKAGVQGQMPVQMKDSVSFIPTSTPIQSDHFASPQVMRATYPKLIRDKKDASATAPAIITELTDTGGTLQITTGHYHWKKDVPSMHTLRFTLTGMQHLTFTPRLNMPVRVGTRTIFSRADMTGMRWTEAACLAVDYEAIAFRQSKVLDRQAMTTLTASLQPHIIIGQSQSTDPHPLNFPVEFEDHLNKQTLHPKGGRTGNILTAMLEGSLNFARKTLLTLPPNTQPEWHQKLGEDLDHVAHSYSEGGPKLRVLINPFNFSTIKEADWPVIIADFVNSKTSTAMAVEAVFLLRRANPGSTQANFPSVNAFGDILQATRGKEVGIAHLSLVEQPMQFLQWMPEIGPMAYANNRAKMLCVTFGDQGVPRAPFISDNSNSGMDLDGEKAPKEAPTLLVATPRNGSQHKGIKDRIALSSLIKKRSPVTSTREDLTTLQLHFNTTNDRHHTMSTLLTVDKEGFQRFLAMEKEVFLGGDDPGAWTVLLVSDCPTDINHIAAVLPEMQIFPLAQNEYRIHLGYRDSARLPEALANNNAQRRREGKNPVFLACYQNAERRIEWLLPKNTSPIFRTVGQRSNTQAGLIYLAGFDPDATGSDWNIRLVLERLGITERAQPRWKGTTDGSYLIEATVQDPEAFYSLNTEILGTRVQCRLAQDLELAPGGEWLYPPEAETTKKAAPAALAKITSNLHTSNEIKAVRKTALKIWKKDTSGGMFSPEQREKFMLSGSNDDDGDSSDDEDSTDMPRFLLPLPPEGWGWRLGAVEVGGACSGAPSQVPLHNAQ